MNQYEKGDFIGMLIHIKDYSLLSRYDNSGISSFSLFKTLAEFEDSLSEIIGNLIETTQGEEGFITISIPATTLNEMGIEEKLVLFLQYIRHNRGLFYAFQTHLLDGLEMLVNKTLYRIKHLK